MMLFLLPTIRHIKICGLRCGGTATGKRKKRCNNALDTNGRFVRETINFDPKTKLNTRKAYIKLIYVHCAQTQTKISRTTNKLNKQQTPVVARTFEYDRRPAGRLASKRRRVASVKC